MPTWSLIKPNRGRSCLNRPFCCGASDKVRYSWCDLMSPACSPRLVSGPAAVNRQCYSSDRGSSVAREEYRNCTDLIDRRKTLVWLLGKQYVADNRIARDAVCLCL